MIILQLNYEIISPSRIVIVEQCIQICNYYLGDLAIKWEIVVLLYLVYAADNPQVIRMSAESPSAMTELDATAHRRCGRVGRHRRRSDEAEGGAEWRCAREADTVWASVKQGSEESSTSRPPPSITHRPPPAADGSGGGVGWVFRQGDRRVPLRPT